jgi:hypothetical protein
MWNGICDQIHRWYGIGLTRVLGPLRRKQYYEVLFSAQGEVTLGLSQICDLGDYG